MSEFGVCYFCVSSWSVDSSGMSINKFWRLFESSSIIFLNLSNCNWRNELQINSKVRLTLVPLEVGLGSILIGLLKENSLGAFAT